MSNPSTDYAELNVTNDDMKELLAEGTPEPVAEKAAPVKKKNVGYRLLALILTVAPIVCLCLLPVKLLINTTAGYAVYGEATLLDVFLALFKKNGLSEFYADAAKVVSGAASSGFDAYKLMGLPVLAIGTVGKAMSLLLYAVPVVMVVTVVLMIVALCSGKAAPALARAIALLNFWVYAGYALAVLAISMYYANIGRTLDILVLAIAGACFLFYLIFSFIKTGKKAWMTLVLFLLTAAFAGAYAYGISQCADSLKTLFASKDTSLINGLEKGEFFKYAFLGVLGIAALGTAVSSVRLSTKKGYTFDLIRYLLHLLVGVAVLYFAFTEDALKSMQLYAGIAAGVALVQILLVAIVLGVNSNKKKAAKKEGAEETQAIEEAAPQETPAEAVPAAEPEAPVPAAEETAPQEAAEEPAEKQSREEPETGVYAEAVRYDGYPAAEENVREAEELEDPAAAESAQSQEEPAAPQPAPVYNYNFSAPAEPQPNAGATAGYDFYNSRSFDPFIASLNGDEREQFTELFILKYKGETKNLPDYQVGGDNTEFFRKVFIYLGQYRDRIPDSLLAKMYQFAVRK